MIVRPVLPLLALLAAPALAAPTFDCSTTRSTVEQAVCADPQLAALDAQLAALYREALATRAPPAAAEVRQSQRRWLRERERCAEDAALVSCIERAYHARIAALEPEAESRPPWLVVVTAAPAAVARCIDAVPSPTVLVTGAAVDGARLRVMLATPTGRTYVCETGRDGESLPVLHDGVAERKGLALRWGTETPSDCPASRPVRGGDGGVLGWLAAEAC